MLSWTMGIDKVERKENIMNLNPILLVMDLVFSPDVKKVHRIQSVTSITKKNSS